MSPLAPLQVVAGPTARLAPVATTNRGTRPPYAQNTASRARFAEVRERAAIAVESECPVCTPAPRGAVARRLRSPRVRGAVCSMCHRAREPGDSSCWHLEPQWAGRGRPAVSHLELIGPVRWVAPGSADARPGCSARNGPRGELARSTPTHTDATASFPSGRKQTMTQPVTARYRARDGTDHLITTGRTAEGRWHVLDTTADSAIVVETLTGHDDRHAQAQALARDYAEEQQAFSLGLRAYDPLPRPESAIQGDQRWAA